MYPIDLTGRNAVIFGVANDRSIAWAIARTLAESGARIALTYQNDRLKDRVARLADTLDDAVILPCDASEDGQIEAVFEDVKSQMGSLSVLVHSIAFANREDLAGRLADTGRDGFRLALEISAFTLLPMVRNAAPLMTDGGSVIAMTFHASSRVYPGYNVMGTAKAALEHEVRQLAHEYGGDGIRVNAISAGPIDTLAARGISGFLDMKRPTRSARRCSGTSPRTRWRRRRCSCPAICRRGLRGRCCRWTPAITSWRCRPPRISKA